MAARRTRVVAGNTVAQAIASVIGKLATFAWTAVAARELTQSGYGTLNLIFALGLIFAAISEWGFDAALTRRIALDPSSLSTELTSCLAWEAALGGILFVVGGAVTAIAHPEDLSLVTLAALLAALYLDSFNDTIRAAAAGVQRQGGISTAVTAERIVTAGFGVAALLTGGGLSGFAIAFFVGTTLGLWWHLVAIRRLGFRVHLPAFPDLRNWARGTAAVGISTLVLAALYRADAVLVTVFLGERALASYSTAYRIFDTSQFVVFAIAGAVFPVLTQLKDDARQFRSSLGTAMTAIGLVYWPFAAICLVDGGQVLGLLFGGTYEATARGSLAALALAPLTFAMAFLISTATVASGELRLLPLAATVATVVNLGVDALVLPVIGIVGAAAMTTVAYLVQGGIMAYGLRRRIGVAGWLLRPAVEPVVAAIAMAGLLWALKLPVVAEIGIGVVVYAVIVMVLLRWFNAPVFAGGLALARRQPATAPAQPREPEPHRAT